MPDPLELDIRRRETQLKSHHPRVTGCRVSVEDRPPRPYERKRFNARRSSVGSGFSAE